MGDKNSSCKESPCIYMVAVMYQEQESRCGIFLPSRYVM